MTESGKARLYLENKGIFVTRQGFWEYRKRKGLTVEQAVQYYLTRHLKEKR